MNLPKLIKNTVLLFWLKRYLFLILFSGLVRLFESVYFFQLFSSNGIKELFLMFLMGIVYDTSVISVLLLISFFLNTFFKWNINILLRLCYFLILLFSVLNFWHLIQFGVSVNYYSLSQINATILKTLVTKPLFWILIAGMFVFSFLFKKIIVIKEYKLDTTWFDKFKVTVFFSSTSLLYLSFPFYYYVHVSANTTINELSKNGIYCFISSVQRNWLSNDLIEDTNELDIDTALKIVANDLSGVKTISDKKIIRTISPIDSAKNYKHIILIIMESMGDNVFNDTIAPNLFKLKDEGIYYSKCKTSGPRTQMGIASLMTGIPNIVSTNFYRRKGNYKIETLADYLTPLNYTNYYLHNGYLSYDDMDKFLLQGGFENQLDANTMRGSRLKNEWGVEDGLLFSYAIKSIKETHNQKTFHVLQSVTNHEPFEIPADFKKKHQHIASWNQKLQTYYYADCVLGDFLRELKRLPEYDNTLVIVTGDHSEAYVEKDLSYKVFHVPLVILGGTINAKSINYDCSHIDVSYTILSAVGYEGTTIMLGENLFDLKCDRKITSSNYNNELNTIKNDTIYRYSFEQRKEWMFLLNQKQYEENQLKQPINKTLKQTTFANYKVVRDYLLNGKIKR